MGLETGGSMSITWQLIQCIRGELNLDRGRFQVKKVSGSWIILDRSRNRWLSYKGYVNSWERAERFADAETAANVLSRLINW